MTMDLSRPSWVKPIVISVNVPLRGKELLYSKKVGFMINMISYAPSICHQSYVYYLFKPICISTKPSVS